MADEKIIRALIRFGLDKESVAQVRGGSKSIEEALKQIEAQADKTQSKSAKLDRIFNTFDQAGRGVARIGMSIRDFGQALNSPMLNQLGALASGVGQLTGSVSDLYEGMKSLKSLGGLSGINDTLKGLGSGGKLAAGAGAAVGGAFLGAQIYDATIGKQQQTYNYKTGQMQDNTAGNILAQTAAVFSKSVVTLTEGADKGNKAFLDTARMYGLVKTQAEEYNDQLKKNVQQYGSSTLYLLNLEKQLKANQASGAGLLGSNFIQRAVGNVASAAVGVAATVSAQSDPAVQAFAQYKENEQQTERAYQQQRATLITTGYREQATLTKEFYQNEKTQRQAYEQEQLTRARDFMLNEKTIAAEQQRSQLAAAEDLARSNQAAGADYQRSRLAALVDFERNQAKVEADYQRQRGRALEEFARNEAKQAKDQQRERGQALEDFTRNDLQLEQQYYADRAKQAERYGIDVARMEEDHRRQMLRMAEDGNARLMDLAQARDAFGVIREKRAQEQERQRSEQDYQIQASRKNQDYGANVGEQEAAFAQQRQARLAEFERSLAEQQAEYDRARAGRKADFDLQRADEQQEHERQAAERKADFNQQAADRQAEFERQIGERKAEFDRQAAERQADYALQAADRKAEFDRQTADRKQQSDQAAGERLAALQAELAQRRQATSDGLLELDKQFNAEKAKREQDFKDRLQELDIYLPGEREKRAGYYKQMADDLDTWLGGLRAKTKALTDEQQQVIQQTQDAGQQAIASVAQAFFTMTGAPMTAQQMATQNASPVAGRQQTPEEIARQQTFYHVGMAAGGYIGHAGQGIFRGGEKGYEFILSHDTTRTVEKSTGGRLSQDVILNLINRGIPTIPIRGYAEGGYVGGAGQDGTMGMLAGGRDRAAAPAMATLALNQNFTFNGSQTDSEKRWYKQVAYDQALTAFNDVLNRRR
jgi:hypothetical protein